MATGCDNKLAGQIGEYLVCADLGRRGLIATPFSGNVPAFDVLVADENCRTLPIQVKASRSDNWPSTATNWMKLDFDPISKKQDYKGLTKLANPDLIYVYVAIASVKANDRFFILSKSEVQNVYVNHYSAWMRTKDWQRPNKPESFDCRPKTNEFGNFEDNWDLIFNRLARTSSDPGLS